MARTDVEAIVRTAMATAGAGENYLLGAVWCNDRYQELCRQVRPRFLRKIGELVTEAEVLDGTVTVEEGSRVVTGDVTAVASWSLDLVGRYLRLSSLAFFHIVEVDLTAGTLLLETPYTESDATDSTYTIVKRYYALGEDVLHLGKVVHPRLAREIISIPLTQLETQRPERFRTSSILTHYSEVGVDEETGSKLVEFWPTPMTAEMIRYSYWSVPENLELSSSVPLGVDKDILQKGVLASALKYKAGQLADSGTQDGAAFFLNWANQEETRWLAAIRQAGKQARASDDMTVQVLLTPGSQRGLFGKRITNSRDHVWQQSIDYR